MKIMTSINIEGNTFLIIIVLLQFSTIQQTGCSKTQPCHLKKVTVIATTAIFGIINQPHTFLYKNGRCYNLLFLFVFFFVKL